MNCHLLQNYLEFSLEIHILGAHCRPSESVSLGWVSGICIYTMARWFLGCKNVWEPLSCEVGIEGNEAWFQIWLKLPPRNTIAAHILCGNTTLQGSYFYCVPPIVGAPWITDGLETTENTWSWPILKSICFSNLVLPSRQNKKQALWALGAPALPLLVGPVRGISLSPAEKAPENRGNMHTTMSGRNLPYGEGGEGQVGGAELKSPRVTTAYTLCPLLNSEFLGWNPSPGVTWKLRDSWPIRILCCF